MRLILAAVLAICFVSPSPRTEPVRVAPLQETSVWWFCSLNSTNSNNQSHTTYFSLAFSGGKENSTHYGVAFEAYVYKTYQNVYGTAGCQFDSDLGTVTTELTKEKGNTNGSFVQTNWKADD
jgi:hypothetical protein